MKKHYTLLLMIAFAWVSFGHVAASISDRDWSIVASYTVSGKASGLAWDGTYIYFGIYGANGDKVYRFDPVAGTHQLQFSNAAIGDSYGMTYDGSNLWIIDRGTTGPSYAKKLDMNTGAILTQIQLPDQYMSGIAWDNGDFWVSTYYPDPGIIYKINGSGTVLTQFAPPNSQIWDVCKENDNLWVVDYNAYMIYKISQTGTVLESHASQSQRPSGIVFDGTYLWYVDGPLGGNSTLYKVDLGGIGTPAIQVPTTNYNYGTVTVGSSAFWPMTINNTGTAPLDYSISIFAGGPVCCSGNGTIPAGGSTIYNISWTPQNAGPMSYTFPVNSNDPVNPVINITVQGNAVLAGPNISAPSSYNYGAIRTNATRRWTMQVQNIGNALLTISTIDFDDDHFYLDDQVTFPINLSPLATAGIDVWFRPTEGILYSTILSLHSNALNQNPFIVNLSGSGQDADYPIGTVHWQYNITGSTDNSPKAMISIPDINNDDVDDVIICSEDNYVRCFNGNASGQGQVLWESFIYSGSIYQQSALKITGDINNDGYADVIVGTAWGDRSVVALSGKTGTILWKHQTNNYGEGGWVYAVHTKFDYNGDGFPDVLAVAGNDANGQGPRRAYCLNGKTGTPIWEHFLGGAGFSIIGINDVNGDGIADAVAGATNSAETQGRVVAISGANGSQLWSVNTSGSSVFALEFLDDINGDGIKDVVAGTFNGAIYYFNAVNGSILQQTSIGNNLILNLTRVDDVNNDGYADIMPGHSGTMAAMLNGYNASAIWNKSMPDKPWNVARIEDVSFDGINDVVVGTLYQNNFVYFLNGVNGNDLFSTNYNEPVDAITAIPDISADSTWEMVAGGRNGKVICYSGGKDPFIGIPFSIIPDENLTTGCYPNPFNDETNLLFTLPEAALVEISIYNLAGTIVWQSAGCTYPAGTHTVKWQAVGNDGGSLNQGIYIYEIQIPGSSRKGKMIYMGK